MTDMSNIAALLARSGNGSQQRSYLDSPMYQQMLAQTLAQGQPQSEYPGQAIANTASQLIQAYMLKQGMQQAQQKQQAGNQSLADALLPGQDVPGMAASAQIPGMTSEAPAPAMPGGIAPRPITTPGSQVDVSTSGFKVDDPNNAGLVAALNGGAIDAQSLAPALMQKFGLGAPKEPMKLGPGDVAFDPVTHKPIEGMSAPFKPDAPQRREATPDIIQIAQQLFPDDPKAQNAYIQKNSPANLRAITNINNPHQNWQLLTEPKTGAQYRLDLDSGKAFTLDGKPFTPSGAAKLVTNQARSPAAMYLQKYQTEHPEATSGDLADVAATFGAQQKAVKDFATGPEGNIITRINTAVSHLDTLQKVGEAMDNGDVQAFNKLRNLWRTQFGSELPTNFNAAMPIVAGEVSKAVVGTQGGTREDRAELEASLQDAASKRQLSGATGTQKSLLQGQLQSRRRQYETATGRKDFDKFLSGDTQRELGVSTDQGSQQPGAAAPVHISGDADYAKLPSGAVFIGPDGKQRKKP